MSYSDSTYESFGHAVARRNLNGFCPSTYMPLDIAAIQKVLGANWAYTEVPGNGPIKLTGEQKIWTLWNGMSPATIDASGYKGDFAIVNLNPGVVEFPTNAGNEYVYNAYGTPVKTAIGMDQGENLLFGNAEGGSTLIGGKEANNAYSVGGRNNLIIAGNHENTIGLSDGAQVVVRGYNPGNDINVKNGNETQAIAWRVRGKEQDLALNIIPGKGEPIRVTRENFQGSVKDIFLHYHTPSGDSVDVTITDKGVVESWQAQALEASKSSQNLDTTSVPIPVPIPMTPVKPIPPESLGHH